MKLIVLILWLLRQNGCSFAEQTSYDDSKSSNFQEMQEFLTKRINEFKLDFHRSFEETRIKRKQKDNYLLTFPEKTVLIEQHLKVDNISAVLLGDTFGNVPILTWTAIESIDHTYLFWGHSNGLLVLADFRFTENGPQISIKAQHIDRSNGMPFKSKYFFYDSFLWFVVAFRSKHREYIAVYQVIHNNLHRRQTIESDVRTDFDITEKGITYMAVSCFMRQTPVESTLESTLKLYEWRHTQFDIIAEQKIYSATSVKLFNMFGTLYMAVSQAIKDSTIHVNNGHEFTSGSPVFVYNARDADRLTYVQIIRTLAAEKVEHFRADGNHYLLFTSPHEDSRIFWWAGDQFLEYQTLRDTRLATDIAVIRLANAEILLALLFADRVKFFTESINSEYTLTGDVLIPKSSTINLFSYVNRKYFALLTYNEANKSPLSPLWKLNLKEYKTSNPYEFDPLVTCLLQLEQTLSRREDELNQLTQRADRVWVANKLQNISAPVIVKGRLRVNHNGFKANNLLLTNTNKVPQITNTMVKTRTDSARNSLDKIAADMQNLVYKSANQTISGQITFTEPIKAFRSSIGNIANANVVLNQIPFHELSNGVLTVNGNQVINSHFSFNDLTINNFENHGLINRLNISDALLANWRYPQTITGNHIYKDVIMQSDLQLHNKFGSINGISTSEFVTKLGNGQQINGRKVFQVLNAKNIVVKGLTNGKDLSLVSNRVVFLDGPKQALSGQIILEAPTRVKRIKLNGLINNVVNVSELAFNAVNVNDDQMITGVKTFVAPLTIRENIKIGGRVNDVKLSRDVITTNSDQTLIGTLAFTSPVLFKANINCETMNGIDLTNDVVRKNIIEPQIVNVKIFNKTISVLQNIDMAINSTIDGVDPSELEKYLLHSKDIIFEAPISFNKLTVHGNVFASHVNGYQISDLPDILWLKSANQTIRVPVLFDGVVKVNALTSQRVNNFKIPEDFVLRMGVNDVIYGEKKFVDNVNISGHLVASDNSRVNGVDLSNFDKQYVRMNTLGTSDVYGRKHFKSVRVNGNVYATRVNGLDITNDIMLINKAQTINANIVMNSANTVVKGNIDVSGNINVKHTVNNVSLTQFVNEIVLANSPTALFRPIRNKIFAAGIHGSRLLSYGTINGINIDELKSRVVTLDTPQLILSSKNFTSITRFNDDVISDYLNDVPIKEFIRNVIVGDKKAVIRGPKIFSGKVLLKSNLFVKGAINSIDVRSLQRRIMSLTRDNIILAPMKFESDINLGELIVEAPATIDGMRVSDLALLSDDLTFNGLISINSGSIVNGDVYVRGLVNGCDLRRLRSEAIYLNRFDSRQTIFGAKQFVNLNVSGNVLVNGLINSLDINHLASKIVTKSGNQDLFAPLTFDEDIQVENLLIRNLINARNISLLFQDAVLRHKPQIITGRKTFLSPMFVSGSLFRVKGNVNVDGLVNGVDVVKLYHTAVRHHESQEIRGVKTFAGPVIFKRNVFVHQSINGIKIPNDLVLVNKDEYIPGRTVFKSYIVCDRHLNVSKLVDGIELSHFARNRVPLTNNDIIDSMLNFSSAVRITNLIVRNTINGIPISALVSRRGRHLINGKKTFLNDVYISGNLNSPGVYNGINIHDLADRAVSLMRPQTIPGKTVFANFVEMNHITITGRLNGIDISDMANFFKRFTFDVDSSLLFIKTQLAKQENNLVSLFDSHLYDRSSGLRYFVLSQEFAEIGERFLISSYHNTFSNTNPTSSLLLWSYTTDKSSQCRQYSSRVYEVSNEGVLTSESSSERGRHFPLLNRELVEDIQLYLWTNTSDCNHLRRGRTFLKTVHIQDLSSAHSKRRMPDDRLSRDFLEAPLVKDAKLFAIDTEIYLILANNYDAMRNSYHTNTTILWLNLKARDWTAIQQIETFGVTAIDVTTYWYRRERVTFLALANKFSARRINAPSYIMHWNSRSRQFEVNAVIYTSNPSSVKFVHSFDGQLYAVFANEKSKLFANDCGVDDSEYNQAINIYHYSDNTFKHIQSVDIYGVVSLDTFTISNETYLVAASPHLGSTFILQLRGYNLFDIIQSFSTPGVESVQSFWSNEGRLHLAIASSLFGHTKILTAIVNGPNNSNKYLHVRHLLSDSSID